MIDFRSQNRHAICNVCFAQCFQLCLTMQLLLRLQALEPGRSNRFSLINQEMPWHTAVRTSHQVHHDFIIGSTFSMRSRLKIFPLDWNVKADNLTVAKLRLQHSMWFCIALGSRPFGRRVGRGGRGRSAAARIPSSRLRVVDVVVSWVASWLAC